MELEKSEWNSRISIKIATKKIVVFVSFTVRPFASYVKLCEVRATATWIGKVLDDRLIKWHTKCGNRTKWSNNNNNTNNINNDNNPWHWSLARNHSGSSAYLYRWTMRTQMSHLRTNIRPKPQWLNRLKIGCSHTHTHAYASRHKHNPEHIVTNVQFLLIWVNQL